MDSKKRFAEIALKYAQRAVALQPNNAVNVLSLAICHGKIALYSSVADKIRLSRLVKEEAERALSLDPHYAWAHHVLGRWHYEVATLGSVSRVMVRWVYGGLPPASLDEAVNHLRKATELEPTETTHWLELGMALSAAGRIPEARESWHRGLSMPTRSKYDESAKERARVALQGSENIR